MRPLLGSTRRLMTVVAVAALVLALATRIGNDSRLAIAGLILWVALQPFVIMLFFRDVVRASRMGGPGGPLLSGWAMFAILLLNIVLVLSLVGLSLQTALD